MMSITAGQWTRTPLHPSKTPGSAQRASLPVPLVEAGYVTQPDALTVQLTASGEQALAQLWNVIEASEAAILDGFSEAEQANLEDYLQRLQANCIRIINQA